MEIEKINPFTKDDETGGGVGSRRKKAIFKRWLVMGVGPVAALGLTVLVTLTVVGVLDWGRLASKVTTPLASWLDSPKPVEEAGASDYWAVFLTSNQVYFGKLGNKEGQYLRLTDVFYLRAQRRLQPPEEGDEVEALPQERQEVQLIKLGDELHGPVDEISFNRDNVLFLERLKNDSRVVRGIEQYKGQL